MNKESLIVNKYEKPSEYIISDDKYRAEFSLEKHPNIALEIAVFISSFSSLEVHFPFMLADILECSIETAHHMLSVATSTKRRAEIIETAFKSKSITGEKLSFYQEVIMEQKYLQKRRDMYAHSLFSATSNEEEIKMIMYRYDFRPSKEEIINIEKLKSDRVKMERLHCSLFKVFKGSWHDVQPLRGKEK